MIHRLIIIVSLILGPYGLCEARDAEDIFNKASAYTVRIDVTIQTPFIEDNKGAGHGAGFVVDKERRWVMTNAHVAGYSPSKLEVVFKDGSRFDAERVYVDPYIDLAIIEIISEDLTLTEAPLDCSHDPETGHPVGAYGHPWGLNFTGTKGVVSGSTIQWGAKNLITDTPINAGNSGGPLISMRTGDVVGINTSSIAKDKDQNTNFAVPIVQACRVLSLLHDGIDPSPPALAMSFYDIRGDADDLILAWIDRGSGTIDLNRGDKILAVGDIQVESMNDLVHELRGRLDGVELGILRNGKHLMLEGKIDAEPKIMQRKGVFFAGMLFGDVPYYDLKQISDVPKVMIHSVERGSQAQGLGMTYLDYVSHIDGVRVNSLEHLAELLASADSENNVTIDFTRSASSWTGLSFDSMRREFNGAQPVFLGPWDESGKERVAQEAH